MKLGNRWLKKVPPSDAPAEWVPVIVEIPRGSKMKYVLDKASGHLTMHRVMAKVIEYPTSYGFVAHTLGEDGDEVDMLVLASEPMLPLTIVRVRPIGGFTIVTQGEGPEHKLIGVALGDPQVADLREASEIPGEVRERIERFFRTYKQDEGVDVRFEGWFGYSEACKHLHTCGARPRKP
jgi:inorganic pyrophosphatase